MVGGAGSNLGGGVCNFFFLFLNFKTDGYIFEDFLFLFLGYIPFLLLTYMYSTYICISLKDAKGHNDCIAV